MNERINELARKAGITVEKDKYFTGDHINLLHQFANLIIEECATLTLDHKNQSYYEGWLDYREEIKYHFGLKEQKEDRKQIGYTEREEGFYPLYEPKRGSVVTQAFILCKYCNGTIYHCMGPRYDAVCLDCIEDCIDVGKRP